MNRCLILVFFIPAFAFAQEGAYVCKDIHGKITMQGSPCWGGEKTLHSSTNPQESPEQAERRMREGREIAERESAYVQRLSRERIIDSGKSVPGGAIGAQKHRQSRQAIVPQQALEQEQGILAPGSSSSSVQPRRPQATTIMSCDSGGCWDDVGGRYNRSAGGNMFRDDGKFCQQIGNMLHCK